MSNFYAPDPKFRAEITIVKYGKSQNYTYDNKIPEKLMELYKEVIGDGLAKVTVSTDYAMKSYGDGTSVMVSITLSCNQDEMTIRKTADLASILARDFAKEFIQSANTEHKNLKISSYASTGTINLGK